MKIQFAIATICLACEAFCCFSQGFLNLNFESATILSTHTASILGWTVNAPNYVNGDPNSIPYNDIALDVPAVNLEGTDAPAPSIQAIQGNYSIFMQGGSHSSPITNGASMMQTGQFPVFAKSMTYWGTTLQVTFNSQLLPFNAISSTSNYTVWGADISAYAGQTGQLMFAVPWQGWAMLDNIKISSLPIPEPGPAALLVAGGLLGAWRWKRSICRGGGVGLP